MIAGFLRGKPVEMVKCETSEMKCRPARDVFGGVSWNSVIAHRRSVWHHTGFYSLEDEYAGVSSSDLQHAA